MIIFDDLTILDPDPLPNDNINNYLQVFNGELVHKPTALLLLVSEDFNRVDQFIRVWGSNSCFNFGLSEMTVLNGKVSLDAIHSQIVTTLINAFMSYSTNHPMKEVVFLT